MKEIRWIWMQRWWMKDDDLCKLVSGFYRQFNCRWVGYWRFQNFRDYSGMIFFHRLKRNRKGKNVPARIWKIESDNETFHCGRRWFDRICCACPRLWYSVHAAFHHWTSNFTTFKVRRGKRELSNLRRKFGYRGFGWVARKRSDLRWRRSDFEDNLDA